MSRQESRAREDCRACESQKFHTIEVRYQGIVPQLWVTMLSRSAGNIAVGPELMKDDSRQQHLLQAILSGDKWTNSRSRDTPTRLPTRSSYRTLYIDFWGKWSKACIPDILEERRPELPVGDLWGRVADPAHPVSPVTNEIPLDLAITGRTYIYQPSDSHPLVFTFTFILEDSLHLLRTSSGLAKRPQICSTICPGDGSSKPGRSASSWTPLRILEALLPGLLHNVRARRRCTIASEERTIALGHQPQCLVCRDCNNLKNIRHRLDRVEEVFRLSNDSILPSCRITLGVLSKILMHVYDRPVCSYGEASQSENPNLEEVV
ncbi:hypothetical protein KCU89_g124, partial [Aureobasidium melanogenum]